MKILPAAIYAVIEAQISSRLKKDIDADATQLTDPATESLADDQKAL